MDSQRGWRFIFITTSVGTTTKTSVQEVQPQASISGLLRLSPELQLEILGRCRQACRASTARTSSALYRVSITALFSDVCLPGFDRGKSFRQACRSDPDLKNQIQSLKFFPTLKWIEWLCWDSAITPLSSLRSVCTLELPGHPQGQEYGMWETLKVVIKCAPNTQRLCIRDALPTGSDWSDVSLPALRRLDLINCYIGSGLLKTLSSSLRTIRTMFIAPDFESESVNEESLDALASLPHLSTLRIYGRTRRFSLAWNAKVPRLVFQSPVALYLQSYDEVLDEFGILNQYSIPNLRQLEITIHPETDIDALISCLLSDRFPLLSVIDMGYAPSEETSFEPLFFPLEAAGFTFELWEGKAEGRPFLWWRAKRGEYLAVAFEPFN